MAELSHQFTVVGSIWVPCGRDIEKRGRCIEDYLSKEYSVAPLRLRDNIQKRSHPLVGEFHHEWVRPVWQPAGDYPRFHLKIIKRTIRILERDRVVKIDGCTVYFPEDYISLNFSIHCDLDRHHSLWGYKNTQDTMEEAMRLEGIYKPPVV